VAGTSTILINQAGQGLIFRKRSLSRNEVFSLEKDMVNKCHVQVKSG
jgi:hypothetical protein